MRQFYSELSSTAQAAYAQLAETAFSTQQIRTVADLSGSFASKTVKGSKYWYYQYSEPSRKLRQIFVGPDNDTVRALLTEKNSDHNISQSIGQLAGSAVALGCAEALPKHLRVIRRLSEYGFFKAGGVLIGTHAFLVYGNMLGLTWGDTSKTQDIDFAHAGKSLSLALPSNMEVKAHDAIESLKMGFLPITSLSGKEAGSYLIPSDPSFKLDFLTTLHRGGDAPYKHPQLSVTLQPVKFMEYSLEDVQQSVIFNRNDAVIVNVPHPARYALHKLIVYGERKGAFVTKSNKDLLQAASLIAYFKENRTWEIKSAHQNLIMRGPGWRERIELGLAALNKEFPELAVFDWLVNH